MSLKMVAISACFLISVNAFAGNPQSIIGVTICATECNNESLKIKGHDEAIVGAVYVAPATQENLENTNVCLSNAKKIKILSNRLTDFSFNSCVDALSGKYFRKPVLINPSAPAPENDLGFYFSIVEIK